MVSRFTSRAPEQVKKRRLEDVSDFGRQPSLRNTGTAAMPSDASAGGGNHLEIIVLDFEARDYAELIEDRLKRIGIKVDMLFPNKQISLDIVLNDLSSRGVLFALLVNKTHANRSSVTLNMLTGGKEEHKNMPVDEALFLIRTEFDLRKQTMQEGRSGRRDSLAEEGGSFTRIFEVLKQKQRLTITEYDKVIKYLMVKRDDLAIELSEPTQYLDVGPKNIPQTNFGSELNIRHLPQEQPSTLPYRNSSFTQQEPQHVGAIPRGVDNAEMFGQEYDHAPQFLGMMDDSGQMFEGPGSQIPDYQNSWGQNQHGGFIPNRGGFGQNTRGGFGQNTRGGLGQNTRGRGGFGQNTRGGFSQNQRGGFNQNQRGGFDQNKRGFNQNQRGGRGNFRGRRNFRGKTN